MQPQAARTRCGARHPVAQIEARIPDGLPQLQLVQIHTGAERLIGKLRLGQSVARLLQSLQFLTGFETHGLPGGNGNLGAGARIAADSGLPRLDVEHAETAQLDPVTLLERLFHLFKYGLDRHFSLGLGNSSLVDNFVDDIELDQGLPPGESYAANNCGQLDDKVEVKSMSSEPVLTDETASAAADFLKACARFATGVTIVTVADTEGQPHGLTVNSFTSVSLAPLLFLVCIDNRVSASPIFRPGVHLAVNILDETQQSLSIRFAAIHDDRFATVTWAPGLHGAPLIAGALATIEGVVRQAIPAGDHTILLTEVRSTSYRDGRPLVYFGSRYRQLQEVQG